MTIDCDACGKSNRATAMFCIGCAGRLPGFAATGPSALEAMRALRPSASRPAPLQAMPAETFGYWMRLGVFGLAATVGFVGWYAHVTRKSQPSAMPSLPLAYADAPPLPPPSEALAAAPAFASTAFDRFDRPPAPSGVVRSKVPTEAVERFYRALSAGDGDAAAAIVTPSKRGIGAYNEAAMSKFYRSFKEPLSVTSIRQVDQNIVEARYAYRVTRTTCQGVALVETETIGEDTWIRRIRANC